MVSDLIIIIVLICILGSAIWYMRKEKHRGVNCIGCPDADTCQKKSCH